MTTQILVVDDDPHIREVICFALDDAGYASTVARDGLEALSLFARLDPDLIILDVGMPELDGLAVCREIRKTSEVPILFLSARDEEIDRILGLEIGGDDYVTKPFSPRELLARIKAIMKRLQSSPTSDEDSDDHVLSNGLLSIDPKRHLAKFGKQTVQLTALEFAILKALLKRPAIVFKREQLMAVAYAANVNVSDRTIDSHIRNIRAKFADAGCESTIETVRGVGFRLGSCEAKN